MSGGFERPSPQQAFPDRQNTDARCPVVAVIVPVFNKARFVAGTLQSVMGQSYGGIKLIVVDDGSTDGSPQVIRETLGEYPYRFVQLKNGGVSRARNRGAAEAPHDAKYLLFLDADDLVDREMVATLVGQLERHPEAAACYCRLRYIDAEGEPPADPPPEFRLARGRFGPRAISEDAIVTPLEAVWSNYCAIPSSCLIRRSAFVATGGWDTALCPPANRFGAEDKDLTIQLTLEGEIHRLPERLVVYRVMPSSRKEAIFEGLKVLNVKWWYAELPGGTRTGIRRAIRFDLEVKALANLGSLRETVRHRRWEEVPGSALNVVLSVARWALPAPRMSRWAGFTRGGHRLPG
jgi:glycosyltransferase involved in cell wall biosynthesis